MFEVAHEWKQTYPEAFVGVLAMAGVDNPEQHRELDRMKDDLERDLRTRYSVDDRQSLRNMPVLAAYQDYYRQFGKTYHVQLQLESVVFKGKRIPRTAALVEAMFMAELNNCLLTAGHDLDAIELPLRIDVATGSESYLRMNGAEQVLKAGDMMIGDRSGIVSCILYGPDKRTRIVAATKRVMFTVYAPSGIRLETVQQHLEEIRNHVKVVAPSANVEMMEIFGGS
ncbi:MAG: phenylalanine--tRNA ligase beta subunit-related protein [Anaerolineales bacterium]